MIVNSIGFFVCAGLITWSGAHLSKQGNRLAELTGLSKAWIGLILMSTVTSLPELVSGISSVVVVKAPDMAVGNVIGSCAFNLLILALLDKLNYTGNLVEKVSHVLAGSLGIVLLTCAGVAILTAQETKAIAWISPFTPLLIIVYSLAVRALGLNERTNASTNNHVGSTVVSKQITLAKVIWTYSIHAMIVTATALILPELGENIAEDAGLSDSFFGTVFLAATTSLPEMVVSVSALRIGAVDMAIGNLLGSNVFNLVILALLDLIYVSGTLYANISEIHLFSVLATIGMTAVVLTGLLTQSAQKVIFLRIHSWIVVIVYILIVVKLNI